VAGETVLQHVARSFEKQYVDPQPAIAQYLQLFFEVGKEAAFANVYDEGGAPDAFVIFTGRNQPRESWQHGDRKIVNAKIPEVLEGIRR
jgi:hypothetical protein